MRRFFLDTSLSVLNLCLVLFILGMMEFVGICAKLEDPLVGSIISQFQKLLDNNLNEASSPVVLTHMF